MKRHLIPLCLLVAVAQSQAAVIQTVSTTANVLNAYAVSNSDLLQSPGVVMTGSDYTAFSSGTTFGALSALTDGSAGGNTTATSDWANLVFEGSSQSPQFTVTYDLDLTSAANGYDLTSISTFTGWTDRASQQYRVFFSTVGDSGFTQLMNPIGDGSFSGTLLNGSTRIVITENSTGILAHNVDAIRFEILPTAQAGNVWREIDVNGVASVPEPSAYGLIGAGALAVVAGIRRRRKMV